MENKERLVQLVAQLQGGDQRAFSEIYKLTSPKAFYVAFEIITINYRPILIDGVLEASYPSSHTMLATCFMTTAIIELNRLLKGKKTLLIVLDVIFVAIAALIVIGRLLAGVHWLTDIIAGLLLSGALISLYCLAVAVAKEKIAKKAEKENAKD